MAFEVVFLHLYALLQLYVVSLRGSVSYRALLYLVLVGALACAPAAVASEYIVDAYFPSSAIHSGLLAAMEEIAKAAPVVYLLFRTRIGASASLVDGVLYGAAVGAGFGIAEDLLYTLETVSLPASFTDHSLTAVITTWLPGGWGYTGNWFPGHLVTAALMGAFFIVGRRLLTSKTQRGVVVFAGLATSVFLHSCFNSPPDREASKLSSFLYYQLAGAGMHVRWVLLAIVIVLILIHERVIRASAGAGNSIFSDVANLVDGLGKGRETFATRRGILARNTEQTNLAWESKITGKTVATPETASETELPGAGTFFDWGGLPFSAKLYRGLSAAVLLFGAGVVLLSPFFPHNEFQDFSNTKFVLCFGLVAQGLLVWRLIYYLRTKNTGAAAPDSLADECRVILTWAGALFAISAWKQLYDLRALPYPLHAGGSGHGGLPVRADVHQNDGNLNGCLRGTGAPPVKGGGFSPIPPMPGNPGDPPPAKAAEPDSGTIDAIGGALFGSSQGPAENPGALLNQPFGGPTPPQTPGGDSPAAQPDNNEDDGLPLPKLPNKKSAGVS